MASEEDLKDGQYLDNNYEQYYFVPWPECQYYEDLEDDDHVIPICTQIMNGCFVDKEWVANGCKEEE